MGSADYVSIAVTRVSSCQLFNKEEKQALGIQALGDGDIHCRARGETEVDCHCFFIVINFTLLNIR